MNSANSSPYLNASTNYYNFNDFGDIEIFSNPGSDVGGAHVGEFHKTTLVGEYIEIKKSTNASYSDALAAVRIGNVAGADTYFTEISLTEGSATNFIATSKGNVTLSGTLNGYGFTSGRHDGANQMVHTDGNGYLQVGYINSLQGYNENTNASPDRIWGSNGGGDSYLRTYRTSALSVGYAASSGYATSAGSAPNPFNQDLNTGNSPEFVKMFLSALGPSDSEEVLVRIASTGEVKKRNHPASFSLRHMKDDIQELTGCLDKLKTFKPKTFVFKQDFINKDEHFGILDQFDRREQLQYGFIVDEIEKSSTPDLVQYRISDDKVLSPRSWKTEGMLAIAVGAIQELSDKVSQLEARIIELEGV
jgi:hypothetical protein